MAESHDASIIDAHLQVVERRQTVVVVVIGILHPLLLVLSVFLNLCPHRAVSLAVVMAHDHDVAAVAVGREGQGGAGKPLGRELCHVVVLRHGFCCPRTCCEVVHGCRHETLAVHVGVETLRGGSQQGVEVVRRSGCLQGVVVKLGHAAVAGHKALGVVSDERVPHVGTFLSSCPCGGLVCRCHVVF